MNAATATPLAPVVTAGELTKVPPGTVEAGAANVTLMPGTGLPKESNAVACRGVGNCVLIGVDCGVPAVALTTKAGPGLLVRLKFVVPVPVPRPALPVTI